MWNACAAQFILLLPHAYSKLCKKELPYFCATDEPGLFPGSQIAHSETFLALKGWQPAWYCATWHSPPEQ